MGRHLESLGSEITVSLETDEDGYIGRECPIESCLGYFKIKLGTGIKDPAPCHCPYCGYVGDHDRFFTQDQIDYAHSFVTRQFADALTKDLKALEFDHKPRGPFGIGISMKLQPSAPYPVHSYREKQLETHVICESCTLDFAIYGVFGWCPDCGNHNSLHILAKNLELARKELDLSASVDGDLVEYLIGDALENAVSAFDGFGREVTLQRGTETRFQNLSGARRRVTELFGFDFAASLDPASWAEAERIFQKRHLLAHKMGVIDADYVQKAHDPEAVVGRRVRVAKDEVARALTLVEIMAKGLFKGLFPGP